VGKCIVIDYNFVTLVIYYGIYHRDISSLYACRNFYLSLNNEDHMALGTEDVRGQKYKQWIHTEYKESIWLRTDNLQIRLGKEECYGKYSLRNLSENIEGI